MHEDAILSWVFDLDTFLAKYTETDIFFYASVNTATLSFDRLRVSPEASMVAYSLRSPILTKTKLKR